MNYYVFVYREETKRIYEYLIPDTELKNKGKRNAGKEAYWLAESPLRSQWLQKHWNKDMWEHEYRGFPIAPWGDKLGIVLNGENNKIVHTEHVPAPTKKSILHIL